MAELESLKARLETSLSAREARDLTERGLLLAAELQSVQRYIEDLRDRSPSETN